MDLGISGRKAIVCASSRGLGRGCAFALAEAGCDIVLNGRDQAALDATAAELRGRHNVAVTAVAGDVSRPEVQERLLAAAPEVSVLINNNGGPPRREFRDVTREALVEGVIQNMAVPIELIRAVVDGMMARGFGRIVNITSSSVLAPIPGLDLSSGARAGLTGFLAGVAREVAHRNVTINNLLPGKIETDRLVSGFKWVAGRSGRRVEDVAAETADSIPARRLGTAEEFGRIAAFLCSVHAGYITGQNILVDGGLLARAF
ncbi:MAG TPA: SDR family oxidoreductase [Bauldia sp.]|nr:SDR family oxidoreductase [Bauldia sp.]